MRSLTPLGQFCEQYLATGAEVASWGKYFLIAALIAAVALAAVEAWKRFKAPSPMAGAGDIKSFTETAPPVKDLTDALREHVTTLATAPVWLALMAVGVFVFWVPGNAIPTKCEAAETYDEWPAPGSTGTPKPEPGRD